MQLGRMRMIALMLFSCCSYCYCGSCGVCVFCCFCCRSPYACLVSQCLFFFVMISTSACLRLRGWGGETCCERQNFFLTMKAAENPSPPAVCPLRAFYSGERTCFWCVCCYFVTWVWLHWDLFQSGSNQDDMDESEESEQDSPVQAS